MHGAGGELIELVEGQPLPFGTHVGLDLVDVERFERALSRHPGIEERLFTPAEISYCRGRSKPALHMAARFAAKEAVGKLLETGVTSWHDIEVVAETRGAVPTVKLGGEAARTAERLGVAAIRVSLSHVDSMAGACVAAVACSAGGEHGRLPGS